MSQGRVNPSKKLEDQGIEGLGEVYYNLIEPDLIEKSLCRGESELGQGGAPLSACFRHVARQHTVCTCGWTSTSPVMPA